MKKRLIAVIIAVIALFSLCGCEEYNKQIIDTTYSYSKAIIILPNGEIVEGNVQSWTDFDDGDQIQVTIDGVTYLVFSSNVALIKEPKNNANG